MPPRSATLATEASVKYVIDVSGLLEAEAVLQAFPKPTDWNQDPPTICQMRRKSLASSQTSLEDFLSPERQNARASRSPFDLMQAHFALAQLHAYDGRMDRALVQYQHAYETARSGVPAAILRMEEALGVAHLHKAGMDNDTHRAPGDICLFPLRPGQSYAKTSDSKRAIEHFQRFLKQKPDDLEVRWLLNLAYMTIGRISGPGPACLSDSAGVVLVRGRRRAVPGCRSARRARLSSRRQAASSWTTSPAPAASTSSRPTSTVAARCTTSATTATARSPNGRRRPGSTASWAG